MDKQHGKGWAPKQYAYAKEMLWGKETTKQASALKVGYSPSTARTMDSQVENRVGFRNAMTSLMNDSDELALGAMAELKKRGFEDFSNREMINAITAISNAWGKFNQWQEGFDMRRSKDDSSANRLRNVVLQQVENQTVNLRENRQRKQEAKEQGESKKIKEAEE